MVHVDELHGEAAGTNRFARLDDVQFAALGQPRHAVVELILEQFDGHAAAVNRRAELAHQVRQAADVILVAVGDENTAHAVAVLQHIGEIRNDGIHARHGLIRENLAAIDDDNVVAVFVGRHVLADFAHAAQRDHAQSRAAGMFAGAGAHRRRFLTDPLQGLRDAGLFLRRNRRDNAAAHARLRALCRTGAVCARARRVAARLHRLGGLLRCGNLRRVARAADRGRRARSGGAGVRFRRARGLSGCLCFAVCRRGRILVHRLARHARAARLRGFLRLIRRLPDRLRLLSARLSGHARLSRRGVGRLRFALRCLPGGVSSGHRAVARRALGLIRMVIVWIAGIASGLILIGLIQVSVFVFCHKNFLSFADCRLRSFKQTHFFRRLFGFPSIALAEVIPTEHLS